MRHIAWLLLSGLAVTGCQKNVAQNHAPVVDIDPDDIGGVVSDAHGPEAGVWVIAETTETPTKLRKIVVTDDFGRFVLPDLPAVHYKVWVRGYGLVDSMPVQAMPGQILKLQAVPAPTPKDAAQYYPANYWYALAEIPAKSEFPGTGAKGNGIGPLMLTQQHWIDQMKTACETCHELGTPATRGFPPALDSYGSSREKWAHRIRMGQDSVDSSAAFDAFGYERALKMYSDWSDRIAAGEIPTEAPPRPAGVERNLVITEWEWGDAATFAHDTFTTDKRNPTVNANGPLYGVDWGNDLFLIVDPIKNTEEHFRVPTLPDPGAPAKRQSMLEPSPYWGSEIYWTDPANPNHGALDEEGRVWFTSRFRNPDKQPAYCATHPNYALAPQPRSRRQLAYFDPKTRKFTFVNTCFDTHHLRFANDPDRTVYANGRGDQVIGWVKTRVLEQTGDEARSQGWCRGYYDINKDGRIDPAVDKPIDMPRPYSVIPNNFDGSVWAAVPEPVPGKIVRIDPKTCVGEAYEPPFDRKNPYANGTGFTPRGIDIDSKGIIWTALAGSGHLASFDRSKCKVLNGPEAVDGQHCVEGWTLYPVPGPRFKGVDNQIQVDYHYYNYVDQFNTLGLGKDVALVNGTDSDSLVAYIQSTGKWVRLRVPYPMNFYQRGMDGRIDDANAGWKGRGLYSDYGENAIWQMPGGKGTLGNVVKFQLRPDPLAK
jgi:hypothetical protein